MEKKIIDSLYTARWALTQARAGKTGEFLNVAHEEVTNAIGILTGKPVETVVGEGKRESVVEIKPPVQVPKPPNDLGKWTFEMPKIEIVKGHGIVSHGRFKTSTGRNRGMVHHYTAGHEAKDKTKVMSMLQGMGKHKDRLGCFGMDNEGVIYIPDTLVSMRDGQMIFDKASYHAGSSKWQGISGLNWYTVGMEVCNPGKVVKVGNDYYAEFFWDRKAKKLKKGAYQLDPKRVVEWKADNGLQHKGLYYAFTEHQVKALINFDLWQEKTNPEFSLDWCVGHDEISQSGKQDPGGCLPWPMPEFRNFLKSQL